MIGELVTAGGSLAALILALLERLKRLEQKRERNATDAVLAEGDPDQLAARLSELYERARRRAR